MICAMLENIRMNLDSQSAYGVRKTHTRQREVRIVGAMLGMRARGERIVMLAFLENSILSSMEIALSASQENILRAKEQQHAQNVIFAFLGRYSIEILCNLKMKKIV